MADDLGFRQPWIAAAAELRWVIGRMTADVQLGAWIRDVLGSATGHRGRGSSIFRRGRGG